MQPFTLRWLIPFSLVVLLLPACGDTADDSGDTTLAPPTTAPTTTTTSAPMSTTTTSSDATFTEMEGFTYLTIDGEAFEGDMYVPEGEGPWPVVVMFHGNPDTKDGFVTTEVAEAAAAAGMQVFVPNWLIGDYRIHAGVLRRLHCDSQLRGRVCPTGPRRFAAGRCLRILCGRLTGISGGAQPGQRTDPRLRRRESAGSDHRSGSRRERVLPALKDSSTQRSLPIRKRCRPGLRTLSIRATGRPT